MKFKIVAVDIDGTLLDSRGELPSENASAIRRTVDLGIKVILVTGRRYGTARKVAYSLELDFPLITHNGALVRYPSDSARLAAWFLSPEIAYEILAVTDPFLPYIVLHRDKPLQGQMVTHPRSLENRALQGYLEKMPQSVYQLERLEDAINDDLIQIMFAGTLSAMSEVEKSFENSGLLEKVKLTKTYYAEKNIGIVDILDKDCSKRCALEFLAGFYDCQPQEILAIGDNYNDLEMLEYAGVGVVMRNCVDELKGKGFEETSSNDDFGVAKTRQRFILSETAI